MSVEIRGVKEMQKMLKEVASLKDIQNAVKVNTTEMHQKASRKVAVDTGHLRRSITTEFSDGGLTGRVYTDVEYGIYQEFGTRFQSGTPFMRPSLYEQRPQFFSDMQRLLKK